MCESATGEDDGVPFQINLVYGVRPIELLILSGTGMLNEFLRDIPVSNTGGRSSCQCSQTGAIISSIRTGL